MVPLVRLFESKVEFSVGSDTPLFHVTSQQFSRFIDRPTWFTPTPEEAEGYLKNGGRYLLDCRYVGHGPIASEEDVVDHISHVWGEDPDEVRANPIYSRFDERIGEYDSGLVRKLVDSMKRAGFGGAVHPDYSPLSDPDGVYGDAYTLVVFRPAKDVKILQRQDRGGER